MTPTLDDLHQALRASWGPDTCAPEDVRQWSTTNVARGQCGTSALVVHDHFGGCLVRGEVHIHGERVDYHWWNLLPSGEEVDFTRAQFDTTEVVVGGNAVERQLSQDDWTPSTGFFGAASIACSRNGTPEQTLISAGSGKLLHPAYHRPRTTIPPLIEPVEFRTIGVAGDHGAGRPDGDPALPMDYLEFIAIGIHDVGQHVLPAAQVVRHPAWFEHDSEGRVPICGELDPQKGLGFSVHALPPASTRPDVRASRNK
ncbi:hypothetical protein JVY00_03035 [Tsukamurella tyrosinosolvens]|uniref:YunG family protein n=1 Tax=Tsukamurella tyrosinosolvens TaxID=57704 RepID=UPI001AF7C88C|nr:hypothetical protein [Tsukamurella tyrosinosolvens]QRY85096.1 hypothetical protein JVY00_03035 [Tsukamurella tyrosinosolvens]